MVRINTRNIATAKQHGAVKKKKYQDEHAIARDCYENPAGSSKVAWNLKKLLLLLHV
jgi:hypothetical protein